MDKPVSMIIEETKTLLADIINNCKLHPAIIEMIVKDIYMEVRQLNAVNAAKEKEQYIQESTKE
jgi:hypothetical protein